jgi:hypothetical protein
MLWKEWRESWWLLIASMLVSIITAAVVSARPFWMVMPWLLLLYCLLPGLLGARLFASETARGTAFFQLERPTERTTIWKARALMPLVVMAANEIVADLFLGRFHVWMAAQVQLLFLLPAVALLIFSASLLCSILMDRPVTALAAGGVVAFAGSLLCIVPFLLMWEHGTRIQFLDRWTMSGFTQGAISIGLMLVIAIGLLFLGRWTYIRQEVK